MHETVICCFPPSINIPAAKNKTKKQLHRYCCCFAVWCRPRNVFFCPVRGQTAVETQLQVATDHWSVRYLCCKEPSWSSVSAENRTSTAAGSPGRALRARGEAAWGRSLPRGTAAPLSSPSSLAVCVCARYPARCTHTCPRERASFHGPRGTEGGCARASFCKTFGVLLRFTNSAQAVSIIDMEQWGIM